MAHVDPACKVYWGQLYNREYKVFVSWQPTAELANGTSALLTRLVLIL